MSELFKKEIKPKKEMSKYIKYLCYIPFIVLIILNIALALVIITQLNALAIIFVGNVVTSIYAFLNLKKHFKSYDIE